MDESERLTEVFFDVQRGLPRQGPGTDEQTLKALAMCTELPEEPDVLDIGCGPGMQTLALASALGGHVTAVDLHEEFLDQLRERASAAGVRDRISVMRGDMTDLPFGPDSFDLIWSEGAAYIMGIPEAFAEWRHFLRPRGYVAVTEIAWLVPDVPAEVYDFFHNGYTGITDIEGNLARIGAAGCDVVGHFTIPDAAWWEHYMTPLAAKLPALFEKYEGDEAALAVVEEARREDELRRRYPDAYGYEFIVARKK